MTPNEIYTHINSHLELLADQIDKSALDPQLIFSLTSSLREIQLCISGNQDKPHEESLKSIIHDLQTELQDLSKRLKIQDTEINAHIKTIEDYKLVIEAAKHGVEIERRD